MNLGVSFCVFSGLDLLKPSLQNIRPFAAHTVAVWSRISSTGEQAPEYIQDLLESLWKEGLLDEAIEFTPKIVSRPEDMQGNCLLKREVGRLACQKAGCTHHLLRDCDEFHSPLQLQNVLANYPNVDCTLSLIREYVQTPTTRIKKLSGLYVPFIQKIEKKLKPRQRPFGVMCDGGRTVEGTKTWKLYTVDELVLHHYTFVRYNQQELRRKYQGHGHCHRIGTENQFVDWTNRFQAEELEQVPDQFGISAYWQDEFSKRWVNSL